MCPAAVVERGFDAASAAEFGHGKGKVMAEKVYVVGAYVSNEDPALRVRAFVPLAAEYRTLDEAVAAAEKDYWAGDGPAGGDVTFVVYKSAGGDAVVEVSRGRPFRNAGFYKIALVEVGDADAA